MKSIKAPKAVRLPSGAFRCRVVVGGKRISITADTRREAEKLALEAKMKQEQEFNSDTLESAFNNYILQRSAVLSPTTIAGYVKMQRNCYPSIMRKKIGAITSEDIQREINDMVAAGKSPKYIANANGLLSSVLKQVRPEFYMNVRLPQRTKADQRRIGIDEIPKIVDAVRGSSVELPVMMAIWMGMRMSEILGAKKSDIVDGKLHIHTALVEDINGKMVEKAPKTFAGDRWVPVPEKIQKLIDEVPGDRLVTITNNGVYKRFTTLIKRAGIPHCKFHDLRHANAAVMVLLGIDSRYAQERNGWSSDRMYKQIYAYTMRDQEDADTKKINDFFNGLL